MKSIMCRTRCVLAVLVLQVGLAHSWDIAVSAGNELQFYTNNTITSTISFKSHNLTALAYDEVHNVMLFVDKQTDNDTICGYDLSSQEINCYTERNGRNIHGIAFDPATDTVFFTDTNERSVNGISLKSGFGNNPNGNLLIKMDDGVARDIVVDSCKGYIYFLNTNLAQPTIERARLDGSEREVFENITSLPFNSTHNLEPHSLAFDQKRQAIYWLEPEKTTNDTIYNLYLSKLNTKHKAIAAQYKDAYNPLFIHPSNTLTASKELFFSVDFRPELRVVYEFSLRHGQPYIKYTFTLHSYEYIHINIGIVANYKIADQIQGQDCEALESLNITAPECDGPFCVHGTRVIGQSVCKCTPGYTGERCDVSVCENYCLQGNCSFNDEGLPECRCDAGYSGIRCEVNDFHGYCLNDGTRVNGQSVCKCTPGYTGERCDVSVCENYCLQGNCSLNNAGLPECRCDAGYTGIRCEVNDCHGYCLNDGECSLNEADEPFCQCVGSYEGARCEADTNYSLTTTSTSCLAGGNLTPADFLSILRKPSSRKFLVVEV